MDFYSPIVLAEQGTVQTVQAAASEEDDGKGEQGGD